MPIIGRFNRQSDGSFVGSIITLSVQADNVRIVPVGDAASTVPTHLVMVGVAHLGEASPGTDGDLRLALDDPSFAAGIEADLREQPDGSFALVWNRNSAGAPGG